jgi:UDP-N-acetyl-2-amino-2-deoxyglucuronate dehydrogenase
MLNFAVIGVGGYIAPRHLKAIRDTGNTLVAATDPNDSVGILDQFGFDVRYFPEIERFDRHLDKLHRGPAAGRVHWVTVCSPNYLHDAHIRLGLRNGANVICEKPLVINPWNLDTLEELERETGCRIATVLQLHSKASKPSWRLSQTPTRGKSCSPTSPAAGLGTTCLGRASKSVLAESLPTSAFTSSIC